MAAVWTERGERSNTLALRLIAWVALHLGRRAARILLVPISIYFVLFAPAARRASRSYLARAFGRKASLFDGYRHVFCFASTILDRIFFLNGRIDLFEIAVYGESIALAELANGRGAFLFGANLGSFEVVRAIGEAVPGLRATLVMYEDNARKVNGILAAINPKLTQHIVPLGRIDSMLRVKHCLDRGDFVGMLCDRTLADEAMKPVQLLGATVGLPVGPFRMAAMLKRPVILMVGLYCGGNRYEVHFERLADFSEKGDAGSIAAGIERYAARLDHFCRIAPYNWFNFFDLWDTRRAGGGANPPSRPPPTRRG